MEEDVIDKPKPKFNPNKDFTPVDNTAQASEPVQDKPKFDANKPFEPLKKKDLSEENQSPSSNDSSVHGQPSAKSTENIQLNADQLTTLKKNTAPKTDRQKQYEQFQDSEKRKESQGSQNLLDELDQKDNAATSLVKGAVGIVKDILPGSFLSARAAGVRTKPYTKEDLNDPHAISDAASFLFRKKISEGKIGEALTIGDEESKRYIESQISQPEEFQKTQIDEKLRLYNLSQKEQKEFEAFTENTPKSLSDIKSPVDVAGYIAYNVGQSIPQVGVSLLTGGMGSYVQEHAEIYDDQLKKIAEDKGITVDEVIKQGLDDPEAGKAAALVAASLDRIGVEAILKNFGKSAFKDMIRSGSSFETAKFLGIQGLKTAVPEGVTEGAQAITEEVGSSLAAGRSVDQSFKDVDPAKVIEAVAAGATSGLALGGAGTMTSSLSNDEKVKSVEEVVKDQLDTASIDHLASLDVSAETIQAKVDYNEAAQTNPIGGLEGSTKLPEANQEEAALQVQSEAAPETKGVDGEDNINNPQGSGDVPIQPNGQPESNGGGDNNTVKPDVTGQASQDSPKATSEVDQKTTSDKEGGDKKDVNKKSLLNRAYEGVKDEDVKAAIEKHGLTYEVESHATAEKNATGFINEVGVENALDAVRKNKIEDGAAAFVWSKAIDSVGNKLAESKDPKEIKELTALESELIDEFDRKARSGGRFISALNEVYKSSDFNYKLDYQIKKFKEVNGGKITPEVEAKFKALDDQLKEANKKLQTFEAERGGKMSADKMVALRQDIQAQKERRAKVVAAKKEKIDSFFNSIKVKTDPNKLNNLFQVVGESTWNGSVEVMRKAVLAGTDVASAIQAGIDYIKEHYRGTDFNEEEYINSFKPGLEKLIPTDEADVTLPSMKEGKLIVPNKLVRQVVEEGAKDINELTATIHDLIKEDLPDVTEREVRDAITKYGEQRTLSQEDIDVKIRGMKRVGKMVSALEDVQNKLRPMRSGLQRDKLTDQERNLQRDIKEAIKDIPVSDVDLEKEWKSALDTVKSRLKNQIADLENQIKTGKETAKKKGIEYDDEANELKDRRDELKSIIESTEGKQALSEEQKVRMAISSVEKSIAEYERRIASKDFSDKPKSTTPQTTELKQAKEQRDKLKSLYTELQKEAGIIDKKKLENYKKGIAKSIEKYQKRIDTKDFITKKKESVKLDEEGIKLKIEKSLIKDKFDLEQEKNRLENRSMPEKIWDNVYDGLTGVQKSLMSTLDASGVLRQNLHYSIKNLLTNPAKFGRDLRDMGKMARSEKFASEWLHRLKLTPEYEAMKKSGLYLSEPTTKLTAKEDAFSSNIASYIPILGKTLKIGKVTIPGLDLIGASERAFAGYANIIRVSAFISGDRRLNESGYSIKDNPEAYKQLGNLINNATGRGNLGGMEKAAEVLAPFMFSARFLASRFNNLAMWADPRTYYKLNPKVRMMAIENMVSLIGFNLMILALYSAGGGDVEDDPRSSNFLKMKSGNQWIDPWAGYQQLVVFFSRILTGQTKVGDKIKDKNQAEVIMRFLRTKASPLAGTITDFATHQDMEYNHVGFDDSESVLREINKSFVPLIIQDANKYMEDTEPTALFWLPYSFFGGSVQTYSDSNKEKKSTKHVFGVPDGDKKEKKEHVFGVPDEPKKSSKKKHVFGKPDEK